MHSKKINSLIFLAYSIFSLLGTTFPQSVIAVERVSENGFAPLSELTVVFANVVGFILTLAGFAVLIMLIAGGFRYIIARGDPKGIAAARGTLTWAVVGLAFILIAFLVVDFIAGFVEIPAVGTFCIPGPGRTCPFTLGP